MKSSGKWLFIIVCLSTLLLCQCKKVADIIPPKVTITYIGQVDFIDHDGDGYYSEGTIQYDLESNKNSGVQVYLWIGYRPVGGNSDLYDCWGTTNDFTVTKGSAYKSQFKISQMPFELPHDHYDLLMIVFLSSDRDKSTDRESEDMRNIPLEPVDED